MNQSIEAIVFDMDGLMFNTEDLYDEVLEIVLAKRGHKFSLELKLSMMGLPGPKAFQVMIDAFDLTDPTDELQEETETLFEELLPNHVQPMPGLLELLDQIEKLGIPKGIATSSPERLANISLDKFNLRPRFEFLLTAESVSRGKPNPDIYLKAAELHNVEPTALLVLEDSHTGSRAAAAAGAYVIAVPTRHSVDCDFSHVQQVATSLLDPIVWDVIGGHAQ